MLNSQPLDPVEYRFWTPPAGMVLTSGPEQQEVALPQIPLPLHAAALEKSPRPTDKMIGEGLYDYLRHFPDCQNNSHFAKILESAYPFYIADLGSQIIMLEAKEVDPPYLRRKISLLKILTLLEPDNFGLLQRVGMAYFELSLIYTELIHVRRELNHARSWFEQARRIRPEEIGNLNYLGQICYLAGAYSQAKLYWQNLVEQLAEGPAKQELQNRIGAIVSGDLPRQPLLEDLEAIGIAMEHYSAGEYAEACLILERLEEEGSLPRALPNPEFFYFLGLSRTRTADLAGAFDSFSKALELDPQHAAARQELDRILDGKETD
jgi:tetratricopeptide (TPR) repeat protein